MPDPRWLDRSALAAHLCVSPFSITRLVREGRIPAPSYHLGPKLPRWDRQAVDATLEAGLVSTDPNQAVHALAQEIAAAAR